MNLKTEKNKYLAALRIVQAYHGQIQLEAEKIEVKIGKKENIWDLRGLVKDDWVTNRYSKSKYLTRGKKYQLISARINTSDNTWRGRIRDDVGEVKLFGCVSGMFSKE